MARWVGHSIEEFKKVFRHTVKCENSLEVTTLNVVSEDHVYLVKSTDGTVAHRTLAQIKSDVGDAAQDAKGVVELATTAETTTGTDNARAVTPDGLKDGYQGSANVTTLGTIATGTWQGTAIATDYLKHKATFELAGYSVADGTNYFYSNIMSGNKAPFLHDVNIGSDGLTADNPAAFLRANGTVMPYNGTLKIWKGWGASNGTPTVDIGIFKYTPTADDATNDSLVLVKNTQITGAGNDNLKAFSETSFSVTVAAGDILITAMKGSVNAKTAYFVSTVEIEWTS